MAKKMKKNEGSEKEKEELKKEGKEANGESFCPNCLDDGLSDDMSADELLAIRAWMKAIGCNSLC